MADVILFRPNEKIVKGGSAIKIGSPGRVIGRPRTRQPRKVVRETLEPAEVQLLNAKPIGILPASEAEKWLPPSQRLSLAQRVQIDYAKQQPRATRAVIAQRDKLVHTEQVLNWRVEVWQIGATRDTDKPLFFYRTECLVLGARGGQDRRSKYNYATPHECLTAGRWKAGEREKLWRGRGRYASPLPLTRAQRRRLTRTYMQRYELPAEAAHLNQPISVADLAASQGATCPVCRRAVQRSRQALRSHFRPHVSKGLLSSHQVEELLSFMVAS